MRRTFAPETQRWPWGLVVWITLLLGAAFPYFEQVRNANELPRLLQGIAVWEDGAASIDGPIRRGLPVGPDVAKSKANGRVYPNKPPGTAVVAVAAYGVSSVGTDTPTLRRLTLFARLLGGLLPTVLLCGFLVRRYAPSTGRPAIMAAVVLYAIGTPAASYAHLFYGHQLAAALLIPGLLKVHDAVAGRGSAGPAAAAGWGALAGAAVLVEYGAVFAAIPLGVTLLFVAKRHRTFATLGAAVAGALGPIVLLAVYHDVAFGSAFSTGYHHVVNPEFAQKHGQGLLGLGLPKLGAIHTHLLSPDGGLLWWAPLCVLGVWGLIQRAMIRGHGSTAAADHHERNEARMLLGVLGLYLLIICSLSFDGGWRVGPRYMVAVLPALVPGWAHVFGQIRVNPGWSAIVMAVGTYQVIVNALAATLWPHFDLTNINHPVPEVLLPLWEQGLQPYGLPRWAFSIDSAAIVIGLTVLTWWWIFARSTEIGVTSVVALVAGAILGVGLVQATRAWPAHPRGARNLAYIVRVWEPAPDVPGDPPSMSVAGRARSGPKPLTGGPSRPVIPQPPGGR